MIENFNNCKQKYGEVLPRNFLEAGLPDMYLNSACRFHTESRISINNLIYLFKEWNKYVRNYDQIDVNSLSYESFRQHIAQAKLKHCLPNTIIVNNNAALGRLDNVKDARNIPVESTWCIKARNKFDEYIRKGGELYAIYLPSESAPFSFNIALIIGGNVIYYNSNNLRQNENWANPDESEHQVFQNKLPNEITNYLYNRAAAQTDKRLNCNKNMNRNRNKNVVRLTEAKLTQIVAESVRKVLNEIGDTHRGQFMLGRVYAKNNEKYDDPSASKLANYAFDRKIDKNSFNGDWDNGAEHQRNMMKATNNPYDFYKIGRNMQFDYDVARDKDMDTLGGKFIDFIERSLLQYIVEYESGHQTGTPESGFPFAVGEFEDKVLGYDCSQSTKKELENAYNRWWYYAQGELMSEDD